MHLRRMPKRRHFHEIHSSMAQTAAVAALDEGTVMYGTVPSKVMSAMEAMKVSKQPTKPKKGRIDMMSKKKTTMGAMMRQEAMNG